MNIAYYKTSELVPYKNNPRKNDGAVDAVAKSIREFGFKVPIIIDSKKEIVCGHTRLKAAKKLNMETVPCIIADDLTEEQIKAFRLADNKTNELASWDFSKLEKEMEGISINMEDFGFDMDFDSFEEEDEDEESSDSGNRYSGGSEENLPEELQGKDLEPEELEKLEGDDETARERVIIVFTKARTKDVAELLGLGEVNKVVYSIEELVD